jgi:hypothetical protein
MKAQEQREKLTDEISACRQSIADLTTQLEGARASARERKEVLRERSSSGDDFANTQRKDSELSKLQKQIADLEEFSIPKEVKRLQKLEAQTADRDARLAGLARPAQAEMVNAYMADEAENEKRIVAALEEIQGCFKSTYARYWGFIATGLGTPPAWLTPDVVSKAGAFDEFGLSDEIARRKTQLAILEERQIRKAS